jgi:hypothetical protein
VLIPYEEFIRFQELHEQAILDRVDQLLSRMATQNAADGEEEVAAEIEAARSDVQD